MSKKLTIIALAVLFLGAFSVLATADEPAAEAPQPVAQQPALLVTPSALLPAAAECPALSREPMSVDEPGNNCSTRWVGDGCNCVLVFGPAWREKEQKNCGSGWNDTGNTRCTNYPC